MATANYAWRAPMKPPLVENIELRESRYKGVVPSRRLRESLSVGNRAKLMLTMDGAEVAKPVDEQVWVVVSRCLHNGRYEGRVAAGFAVKLLVSAGALVEFGPEHICDWQPS